MTKYNIPTFARNAIYYIYTKFFFKNHARIVKCFPRLITIGHINFGTDITLGVDARIEALSTAAKIKFGNCVKINDYCHIGALSEISIGDNVLIGSRVTIVDHDHGVYSGLEFHSLPTTAPDSRELPASPIYVGDNTWIAEGVTILSGVRVGPGCVIGANSVVASDIPDNSIAAGVPAKVIKKFNKATNSWEKQ